MNSSVVAKNALINILGQNANGLFNVIGYEGFAKSAEEYEGDNRTVRCFLSKGDFPRDGGSDTTPCKHDVTINFELICTAASSVDIGTIMDPDSTAAQRADALAGSTPAGKIADDSWDELRCIVWNIVMAGKHRWLGLEKGFVNGRFITSWEKDRLVPNGSHAIQTGFMTLVFEVDENSTIGLEPRTHENSESNFRTDDDGIAKTVSHTGTE